MPRDNKKQIKPIELVAKPVMKTRNFFDLFRKQGGKLLWYAFVDDRGLKNLENDREKRYKIALDLT